MSSTDKLYTPTVLALAASLARWPLDDSLTLRGEARSPTCGGTITLGLDLAADGAIARLGLLVRACAIGQASSAIFAAAAPGQTRAQLAAALDDLQGWLSGGTMPYWPGIEAIAAARDFPARHGAILLPWRAALVALDQPG